MLQLRFKCQINILGCACLQKKNISDKELSTAEIQAIILLTRSKHPQYFKVSILQMTSAFVRPHLNQSLTCFKPLLVLAPKHLLIFETQFCGRFIIDYEHAMHFQTTGVLAAIQMNLFFFFFLIKE